MEKPNYKLGHRSRVKDNFLRNGADAFCDYEILELLLFYTIPRRDTKGMAHALMREFSTLEAVLTASEEELCRVEGIGPRTARFLRSLMPFASYVLKSEARPRAYRKSEELCEFFQSFFLQNPDVPTAALLLDNSHKPLRIVRFNDVASISGFVNSVSRLVAQAYSVNAPILVLAGQSNDPRSSNVFLLSDVGHILERELSNAGVALLEIVQVNCGQPTALLRYMNGSCYDAGAEDFIRYNDVEAHFAGGSPEAKERLRDFLSLAFSSETADETVEKLLSVYPSLLTASTVPYVTLTERDGIESAAALLLRLALDTYARAKSTTALKRSEPIQSTDELGQIFSDVIGPRANETMAIAVLDDKMKLLAIKLFGAGTVNTAVFSYRSMLEETMRYGASFVAVAHNHPLGVTAPSSKDICVTAESMRLFSSFGTHFLEHFVVTEREYFSISRTMAEQKGEPFSNALNKNTKL